MFRFFIFLFFCVNILPAEHSYKHFSTEDGLPNEITFSVQTDKQGFVWISTRDNLVKYDGFNFHSISDEVNDDSFSWLPAFKITESENGTLWIGTFGKGLIRYSPLDYSWDMFCNTPSDDTSLSCDTVGKIFVDSRNRVWVPTYGGGVNLFDKDSKSFRSFRHNGSDVNSLSSDFINVLVEDQKGFLWAGSSSGHFDKINPESGEVSRLFNINENQELGENVINDLFLDDYGVIWIASNHGLYRFDEKSGESPKKSFEWLSVLSDTSITCIERKNRSEFWIGTVSNYLYVVNHKERKVTSFITKPIVGSREKNSYVSGVNQTANGELWVSTMSGVDYYAEEFSRFDRYGENNRSRSGTVMSLAEGNDGKVWGLKSKGGLFEFNPENEHFETFESDSVSDFSRQSPQCLRFDNKGDIWITTTDGVYIFSTGKMKIIEHYRANPDDSSSLSSNNTFPLAITPNGQAWIGSAGKGIELFDRKRGVVDRYSYNPGEADSLNDNWGCLLFLDSEGILWAGGDLGLNRINTKTREVTQYKHEAGNRGSLSAGSMYGIIEDKNRCLWVLTSRGLSCFDKSAERFKTYDSADFFNSSTLLSLVEDDQGFLWIGSNRGLFRFCPDTQDVWRFSTTDGLTSNTFCENSVVKGKNGALYFGTISGLTHLGQMDLNRSTWAPPLYITGLEIFNKVITPTDSSILSKPIAHTKSIILNHNQAMFSLVFSALDFKSPVKLTYKYKLEGFDKEWIETEADNRRATYTNLPYGLYQFRVKSTNSDGVWVNNERILEIRVLPPWWKTWWFRSFCLFIAVFLVSLVYVLRVKNLKKRQHILEATVREKTKDLRKMYQKAETEKQKAEVALNSERKAIKQNLNFIDMISHEYRTPLSVISLCTDVIDRRFPIEDYPDLREQSEVIRSSCNRLINIFEKSMTKNMTNGYEITVNKQEVTVSSVVEGAMNYIKRIYHDYSFCLDFCCDKRVIFLADRELLITAFCNILDNACKYSEAGSSVKVLVESLNSSLVFIFSDEGCGIKESELGTVFEKYYRSESVGKQQGTGVGLFLVKNIIELHGGSVSVESVLNKGTVFKVVVPVNAGGKE